MKASVLVHVLTYNSTPKVERCLEAVLLSQGFIAGQNLTVELTDNASEIDPGPKLERRFLGKLKTYRNSSNLGFCGGHNLAVKRFLEGNFDYLLILNPDAALEPEALARLVEAIHGDASAGMATPLILRADENLEALSPPIIDAAGMRMTAELRHLDRGSGEPLEPRYLRGGYVFGGTGACLLLKRSAVQDLLVDAGAREADIDRIYPQLGVSRQDRALLFDEGFFAYREDAELAWRAQRRGWRVRYVPEAVVLHERRVLPERRQSLPPELNMLGVRNRFLLQGSNLTISVLIRTFLRGVLLRNLLVLAGVLFFERSSLAGILQAGRLLSRALARRARIAELSAEVQSRLRSAPCPVSAWFGKIELVELT